VIDDKVGSAELDLLAEGLATPCRIGDYALEGLISKTSTALLYVARGGAFGDGEEGVLKLSGPAFAPLLERELKLLNQCQAAGIDGVVRPLRAELEWLELDGQSAGSVAAIPLPFLAGGDLVQWIGAHAGHLGARLALDVADLVGRVLRNLLLLARPLVHGDVKPQNLLLPSPEAALTELTLIDLDASEELDISLADLAGAPRGVAQYLVDDVNDFGELLYVLATGQEPAPEDPPNLTSGNPTFDALVVNCLTSEVGGGGYACLADDRLWRDLEAARSFERGRERSRFDGHALVRPTLGVLAIFLFCVLVLAVASKFGSL
jgi:hypothetical protein